MIGATFVKFGQLILMKITKIVATGCQILSLKCIELNFDRGSASDLQRSPRPLAGFKGPTSKGRGGERREWMKGKGPLYISLGICAHENSTMS